MLGATDANPDRVGIRVDVFKNIIRDLNGSVELQQMFGEPVSGSLVIVAHGSDLRIEVEESVQARLAAGQIDRFLAVLEQVLTANRP